MGPNSLTRLLHICSYARSKCIPPHLAAFVILGLAVAVISGCRSPNPSSAGPSTIRTPHPTFTPTVPVPQPTPAVTPEAAVGGALPAPAQDAGTTESGSTGAKVVVNSPLVNVRTGPGTEYEVVTMVERGAEYDIVAKNSDGSWWKVCCIEGAEAWIISEYVDTDGPVDSVPVDEQLAATAPTEPAAPAETSAPADQAPAEFTFDLRNQEQFAETGMVRIYLYVYSGNDALAGYSLRIFHNGAELPVEGTSFAGQPALTWPFQDARQRYQNFKVEFPDVEPAGVWEVQLIDSSGNPVGPTATFTLASDDPQQELYVRYERR